MMRIPIRFTSALRNAICYRGLLFVLLAVPAASRAMTLVAVQPATLSRLQAPLASPSIASIDPKEAARGRKVKISIQGQNILSGAYVTFSNPALHAVSTHQDGNGKITVEVQVAPEATLGPVSLYVTNPSGASATFPLTVTSGVVSPNKPAASQPTADTKAAPSPSGAPAISKVAPSTAGPGSNFTLTIKGENFVQGATVAFSNPKITVTRVAVKSKSELTAQVQIASSAATGSTGLFVVNPDQSEVEGSFTVSGAAINTGASKATASGSSATSAKGKSSAAKASGNAISFNVFNLGDVVQVFKTKSKVQGTLTVDNRTLTYVENGVKVFSVPATAVQEIAPNVFFGLNTGTFHIFLSSSKHYNFAAASLNPADTQKMESQLQQALK